MRGSPVETWFILEVHGMWRRGTVKGPGGECESAVLKIMMFRSNYLHLSDTSGMAILWEVTGGAAFSVLRSRQLDTRRRASPLLASVFREPCHCVPVVLRHAFTICISQSHFVLSNGITHVGSVEDAIHIRALNCFLDCQNKLLPGGC